MDLKLFHGSTEYPLNNPEAGGLILVQHEGLGIPTVERLTQRTASGHGVIDQGYYVNPRRITLKVAAIAETWEQYALGRDLLGDALVPASASMVLQVTRPGGSVRQIECHLEGAVPLGTQDRSGMVQEAVLSLLCPDPFWLDPNRVFLSFGVAGGGSGWVVPVTIPMTFGASALEQVLSVAYAGNVIEYPVLEIVGPITSPIILNQTTGEKLDFTGITIAAGHTYFIDCRPRYKTIKNHLDADKIADITDNSDLSTFHLAPKREAAGGLNSIKVSGSGISTATAIYLRYYNRYLQA